MPADTAGTSLLLARVRVGGETGARVTLTIEDSVAAANSPVATADLVLVRVGAVDVIYSIADVSRGVTIHEFAEADTVAIEYRLLRGVAGAKNFVGRLVQRLAAGASVIEAARPWVRETSAQKYLSAGATADVAFPTWNLRDIYTWFNGSSTASSTALPYPLVPTSLTFGSTSATPVVALPGGSSFWYELSGTQTAPQLLRLEGSGGSALPTSLRLAIARLQ